MEIFPGGSGLSPSKEVNKGEIINEPQPHLKPWAPRVRDPAAAAMCYSGHPENCAVGDWSWMGEWHGRNGRLTLC